MGVATKQAVRYASMCFRCGIRKQIGKSRFCKRCRAIENTEAEGHMFDRRLLVNAPPVTMVLFTPLGMLLHGRCKQLLAAEGVGTNRMGRRELGCFCPTCKEHVFVPEDMVSRISICRELDSAIAAAG